MSRLSCQDHKRRVLVLDRKTVHRSDGTECTSASLKTGDEKFTPDEIRKIAKERSQL